MKKILVTGGAGYIGSHVVVELCKAGYEVIIYDNLSNSSIETMQKLQSIVNKPILFFNGDIRDSVLLNHVFDIYDIDSVIHLAGFKAVGESVQEPLKYYNNNVQGTLVLLEVMKEHNVKKIVFSSSATVYGDPESVPIIENFPLNPTNPYGRTKLFIEEILRDMNKSDDFKVIILRYFNPIGAHESGLIGEDPNGIPNNLMPFISQVAIGKIDELSIFGGDYNTPDGTGVRDYIHVVDLAKGHVAAINKIDTADTADVLTINLGTGKGYSVLELGAAFEKASGVPIKYSIKARRDGDIAECYTDPSYANKILGWKAEKTIQDMCADTWRWQINNPNGYKG